MKSREWCHRWVFRRCFSPCDVLLSTTCLGRFIAGLFLAGSVLHSPRCPIPRAVSPLQNLASAHTLSIKISVSLSPPLPPQSLTYFLSIESVP